MNELVIKIYNDGRYKSVCKDIAKRKELAEELHSTFILSVLEMKPEQKTFLQTLSDSGNLEVYCIGIINRIWNNRNRVKSYEKGSTSPLFDYSSTLDIKVNYGDSEDSLSPEEFFSKPTEDYNINIDYISNEARELIERECDSPNMARMYKARVFKYSYIENANPDQFSKKVKIPRASIRATCYQFRDFLKQNLNL